MNLEEIRKAYLEDRDGKHRSAWLKASEDARCFMNNDLSPLEADGLIKRNDPNNPVVEKCDIPEKVRFIQGRIFSNEYEPAIVPYEGESLDEPERMIAGSLFRHERSDRRDVAHYNLDEQVDLSVMNALVDGMGYLYETGDETLRDELFYLGKPLYRSIDPRDVILDKRARTMDEVKRIHIVLDRMTQEEFKNKYPKFEVSAVGKDWTDKIRDTDEEVIPIIETQYINIEWLDQVALTPELQQLLKWDSKFATKNELVAYLKEQKKADPEGYAQIDPNEFTKDLPEVRTKIWNINSVIWAGLLDKPLEKERDIGKAFSIHALTLIDAFNQAYAYGIPYFLRSLQILATIARTIQARTVLRMDNPGGFFREGTLSEEDLADIEANEVGKWTGLKIFEGTLKDNLWPREISPHLQYLERFVEENKEEMNAVFATWREQLGQAGFAGQSGKMAQVLLASGSYSFVRFARKIENFLVKVYENVLKLAAGMIPPKTLIVIAAEGDPLKQKAIMQQSFYQRIQRVNVSVKLDTSTESDKAMFKNIIQALLTSSIMAPESGFRELGFKEPQKLAREIDAWLAQRSKAEYYAQRIQKMPELGEVLDGAIEEFDKNYKAESTG